MLDIALLRPGAPCVPPSMTPPARSLSSQTSISGGWRRPTAPITLETQAPKSGQSLVISTYSSVYYI